MEAPKETSEEVPKETSEEDEAPKRIHRPRPPKTPAQLEAFKKAVAVRTANSKRRKDAADELLAQTKKETEDKVVRKAIAIKKKQIKAQIALEEISSDDEPIEVIKQKIKKVVERPPPKITFTFV